MASVTSLDKDLRNMRRSKYTPQAANEVRQWIEEILQEKLRPGDLLDALRDGVVLCRLVNLAVSPGVKYKASPMPFVQMENISHFLRACQMSPLSLPPHDVFLTVDLYEAKDPAQVLQCLGAFSRKANAIQPSKFPYTIGGNKSKSNSGVLTPQGTASSYGRARGVSNVSETGSSHTFSPVGKMASPTSSGRISPVKGAPGSPPPMISSWSRREDEGTTAPAWNIHQYGYMGGASQGNQGITFGGRRQITTPSPVVPSLAEKEKRRRELEAEQELKRQEEARRERERIEDEERAKAVEERRWAEETEALREKERREMEEEKRRWDEEQHRWEEDERRRREEEKVAVNRFERERVRKRESSDERLNGQFLSQYQAGQKPKDAIDGPSAEQQRIKELERELEFAKQREQRYERERQGLVAQKARSRSRSRPRPVQPSYDLKSQEEERKLLRSEWQTTAAPATAIPPALPNRNDDGTPPPPPPRPLPDPARTTASARPLPDPASFASSNRASHENRTDRFLSRNAAPVEATPMAHRSQDYSSTAEIDAENSRRVAATQKTRAGGWASKSLLEREMERERERQREWEESQKQTQEVAKRSVGSGIGTGPGQGAWDVSQYGYLGGDSQNRGGPGLGVGGARRQIIGPRPPP